MKIFIEVGIEIILGLILIIDLKKNIIYNSSNLVLLILVSIYCFIYSENIYKNFTGGLILTILFFIIYMITKKGLGGGDVKLAPGIGLLVGVDILDYLLIVSVLSILTIPLMLIKKTEEKELPFAPVLILSLLLIKLKTYIFP